MWEMRHSVLLIEYFLNNNLSFHFAETIIYSEHPPMIIYC